MLPVSPPPAERVAAPGNRWGLILAGGEGLRLRSLTRLIGGDDRPKQFCPLFGGRTLLEQTLRRSELNIPKQQLIVSLTGQHEAWYSRQAGLLSSQRVVQPANKGTAPPILHGLLSLAKLDPQALVAILPCDHHYADEESFASALERAFEIAAEQTGSVVLLGAKPDYPEVEYGWIELGSPVGPEGNELFRVKAFREKPVIDVARTLFEQGSVWNTFVMVGHVQAFLQIIQATLPDLLQVLAGARMWDGQETRIEDSVYERIPSVCYSRRVLSGETARLAVLRLNDVGWSDLGDPGRVLMAVRESGWEPAWIRKWKLPNASATAALRATSAVA